jgi:hypothetical protein
MYFRKMTFSAMISVLPCLTNFLYGHYNLPECAFPVEFYSSSGAIQGIAPENGSLGPVYGNTAGGVNRLLFPLKGKPALAGGNSRGASQKRGGL